MSNVSQGGFKRRKVTSSDVAVAAGVSRSTVSLVLNRVEGVTFNPETVRRVQEAAKRLGYVPNVPARSVMTRKGYALGLISAWEPGSTLFARTFQGMLAATRAAGYGLTLCDIAGRAEQINIDSTVSFYQQGRIDGVVALLSTLPENPATVRFRETLEGEKIPFVFVNSHSDVPTVDEIRTDNFQAGYIATKHLLDLGHRRVGICVRGASGRFLSRSETERYRGYVAALTEAGLVPKESLTVKTEEGPINVDRGYQAFKVFLESGCELPSALYAISDHFATGVLYAAKEKGISIPGDLAIVGTDDLELASQLRPSLTSVRQPLQELGEEAVNLLLKRIDGKGPSQPVKLHVPCSLRVRQSSGAGALNAVQGDHVESRGGDE